MLVISIRFPLHLNSLVVLGFQAPGIRHRVLMLISPDIGLEKPTFDLLAIDF
jgi:hypothetical protein